MTCNYRVSWRVCELYEKTPYSEEVFYAYDSFKEVGRNYFSNPCYHF